MKNFNKLGSIYRCLLKIDEVFNLNKQMHHYKYFTGLWKPLNTINNTINWYNITQQTTHILVKKKFSYSNNHLLKIICQNAKEMLSLMLPLRI